MRGRRIWKHKEEEETLAGSGRRVREEGGEYKRRLLLDVTYQGGVPAAHRLGPLQVALVSYIRALEFTVPGLPPQPSLPLGNHALCKY